MTRATPVLPVPVLLAAGRSARFEAGHKLLAPLGGEPVIVHVLRALAGAGLGAPLVILGGEAEAVERALAAAFPPDTFDAARNSRHAEGMGTSLALAARLRPGLPLLVALGDMPCLRAADHAAVAAALDPDDPRAVARGTAEGEAGGAPGHPVAFGPGWSDDLAALDGDRGAASLLRGRDVARVPLDPATQIDVDTRAALARAAEALAARAIALAIARRPL